MDDEFREFTITRPPFGDGPVRVTIRQNGVVGCWKVDVHPWIGTMVLLAGGHSLGVSEDYESVRDWLMGRDAPVTLDAGGDPPYEYRRWFW